MKQSTVTHANSPVAIALTIAGSDSGGGAGIQADIKTFSSLKVYATSVVTAVTAQNTIGVIHIHEIPVENIAAQMSMVFDDIEVRAVKIGMLSSTRIIETVANGLKNFNGPIILDPVMVAKSGDLLLSNEARTTLRDMLFPIATLLTPNLPEAAAILDVKDSTTKEESERQGRAILDLGVNAVLMKGGHLDDADCEDLLILPGKATIRFSAPRISTQNTHGTGCALSAAIAANMSKGIGLIRSVSEAKEYLYRAIAQADVLGIGSGCGPVHHFHQFWNE